MAGALPGLLLPVAVLLVLAYGAGAFIDARPSAIALGLALALVCSTPFLPGAGSVPTGIGDVLSSLFYSSLIVFPGWFVGRLVHRQARRGQAFRRLATEAAEEQDRRRTLALAEERDRIGRELQDIVTHAVSSMVVQAGGARLLLRTDPERARVGILNVEHTGREALADLRRMLGMLRKDDDPRSLSPQPGLDRVPELIASSGQAGLRCDLQFVGERVDLTPGVDLVAYRAIEEVLAAARRHGAATALVTVDERTGGLELTIRADHLTGDVDHDLDAIVDRIHLYDGSLRVEAGGRASGRGTDGARAPAIRRRGAGMTIGVVIADDQALVRPVPHDPRGRPRAAHCGRGQRRGPGGRGQPPHAARRRPDGHPHAGDGRAGGDPSAHEAE